MNLDDETLLTAYLDGELDAAARHRVEAALLSSPALDRRCRELADARDLVESLPRPVLSCDLTDSVLERIKSRPGPWSFRVGVTRVVSPRWLAVGSSMAAAAALFVAAVLTVYPPQRPAAESVVANPARAGSQLPPRPVPLPHDLIAALPRIHPPAVKASPAAETTGSNAAEIKMLAAQDRVRELLEQPNVRKITILVDKLDRTYLDSIDRSIHETARKYPEHGEIQVAQGIVIDPQAPNEAVVYAMVVDDHELARFHQKLRDRFDRVSDVGEAPAEQAMQLAELGRVSISVGTPAAGLADPPLEVGRDRELAAVRDRKEPGESKVVVVTPDGFPVPRELSNDSTVRRSDPSASGETPRAAHHPDPPAATTDRLPDPPARSADLPATGRSPAPAPASGASRPITLLVWVTTQPEGR
jgi:hypothetical protein